MHLKVTESTARKKKSSTSSINKSALDQNKE